MGGFDDIVGDLEPDDGFENVVRGIVGQESGGNYRARNPDSGALGKYQVMPSNLPQWGLAHVGRPVTPREFLGNPDLQEKIARGQLRTYYDDALKATGGDTETAAKRTAAAWYSGDPNKYRSTASQGKYPSVAKYAANVAGSTRKAPASGLFDDIVADLNAPAAPMAPSAPTVSEPLPGIGVPKAPVDPLVFAQRHAEAVARERARRRAVAQARRQRAADPINALIDKGFNIAMPWLAAAGDAVRGEAAKRQSFGGSGLGPGRQAATPESREAEFLARERARNPGQTGTAFDQGPDALALRGIHAASTVLDNPAVQKIAFPVQSAVMPALGKARAYADRLAAEHGMKPEDVIAGIAESQGINPNVAIGAVNAPEAFVAGTTMRHMRPTGQYGPATNAPGEGATTVIPQLAEVAGITPYFFAPNPIGGLSEAGLAGEMIAGAGHLAGIEGVSGRPLEQQEPETDEQYRERVKSSAILGGVMAPAGRVLKPVLGRVAGAIDERLGAVAPALGDLGSRSEAGASLVAAGYPAALIEGKPLPTWQQNVQNFAFGLAMPAGHGQEVRRAEAEARAGVEPRAPLTPKFEFPTEGLAEGQVPGYAPKEGPFRPAYKVPVPQGNVYQGETIRPRGPEPEPTPQGDTVVHRTDATETHLVRTTDGRTGKVTVTRNGKVTFDGELSPANREKLADRPAIEVTPDEFGGLFPKTEGGVPIGWAPDVLERVRGDFAADLLKQTGGRTNVEPTRAGQPEPAAEPAVRDAAAEAAQTVPRLSPTGERRDAAAGVSDVAANDAVRGTDLGRGEIPGTAAATAADERLRAAGGRPDAARPRADGETAAAVQRAPGAEAANGPDAGGVHPVDSAAARLRARVVAAEPGVEATASAGGVAGPAEGGAELGAAARPQEPIVGQEVSDASTVRGNQGVAAEVGQEPEGGEVNRGGNVPEAASGALEGSAREEAGAEAETPDGQTRGVGDGLTARSEDGQKRAAVGGEIGPNGEFYKGGAFIATTDQPKAQKARMLRSAAQGATALIGPRSGRVEVPPGEMSIFEALGPGAALDPRAMELNQAFMDYQRGRMTADEFASYYKNLTDLLNRWHAGERFVKINDFPQVIKWEPLAHAIKNGITISGEVIDRVAKLRGISAEEARKQLGIKQAGGERGVGVLAVKPSETLAARRGPTEPPFEGVKVKPGASVRTAHEIDVDSATAEKIKRALVNQKDWDGVTIPMPLVERVITNLRAGERTKEIQTLLNGLAQAKQRFDNGRGPNSVRVIDVNAVRRASVGEKGVRREESWHVTQYHHTYEATGQHDGVDWQTPAQWERLPKDIAETVLTEVVKRGYADAKTNHDVKVLEASAKIAGEVDALGLTEEQVVAFMNHTYDAIAENFGPDAIFEYDANSRRAIIAQKEAYARAKGKAADQDVGAGSEGTQRTVSDQAPAGEGSVRQGGEGEVSGNRGEARYGTIAEINAQPLPKHLEDFPAAIHPDSPLYGKVDPRKLFFAVEDKLHQFADRVRDGDESAKEGLQDALQGVAYTFDNPTARDLLDAFDRYAKVTGLTPEQAAIRPRGKAEVAYRGEHTAPDRESGSPLHDLTGNVMPVYVRMENPLDATTAEGRALYDRYREYVKSELGREAAPLKPGQHAPFTEAYDLFDYLRQIARTEGSKVDGLIVHEGMSGNYKEGYVPLNPEQIKSAIGNRGTFEPDNPNILMARTGPGAKLTDAELAEDMPDLVAFSRQEQNHDTSSFAKWSKEFTKDVSAKIDPQYAKALGPHLRQIYEAAGGAPAASARLEPNLAMGSGKARARAPRAGEGETAQGAPASVGGRIAPSPIRGGEVKPITEIVKDLAKGLNRKVGRAKMRRSEHIGEYLPWSGKANIRYTGDLDVTAHEIGHLLDDTHGIVSTWAGDPASPFDAELVPTFSRHGSEPPANLTPEQKMTYRRAEGVAEWIRALVVNPDAARKAAPLFAAHFEKSLPADVRQVLDTYSDQVRRSAGLTPTQKVERNVQMEAPKKTILERLGIKKGASAEVQAELTDSLAPLWKPIKSAIEMRGIPEPERAFQRIEDDIRTYAGTASKMEVIYKNGMINFKTRKPVMGGIDETVLGHLDRTSKETIRQGLKDAATLGLSERMVDVERMMKEESDARRDDLERRLAQRIADGEITSDRADAVLQQYDARAAREIARRMERVSGVGAGMESDIDVHKRAIAELEADPARYAVARKTVDSLRDWADSTLRYMVDGGRMSEKEYDDIAARNGQYMAMQRIIDEAEGLPGQGRGRGAIGTARKVIHRWTGSTREIANPIVSTLHDTAKIVEETDRNAALLPIRDLLTEHRGMYQGEQHPLSLIGSRAEKGDPNTVTIYVKGEPEYWQFDTPIYKAIKGLGKDPGGFKILKPLAAMARLMRVTITNAPGFIQRNVLKDAISRPILSQIGSKPWDIARRVPQSTYEEAKLAGIGQFGHLGPSRGDYHKMLDQHLEHLRNDRHSVVVRLADAGRAWKHFSELSEMKGRIAEYQKAKQVALKQGMTEQEAQRFAAARARELMDFAVGGNLTKALNQYVPFTNAAVQGLRAGSRAAVRNPGAFALKTVAYTVLPEILTYMLNAAQGKKVEDEYNQMAPYLRDFFWNIKIGDDRWLRIPKPYELGMLASAAGRAIGMSRGYDNPWEGFGADLVKALAPVDPDAAVAGGPLKPLAEVRTGYDFFRDDHYIPSWDEDVDVALRDTSRASRFGQFIQQMSGNRWDARDVDHLVRGWGGGLADIGLKASDLGRADQPAQGEKLTNAISGLLIQSPAWNSKDAQFVMERSEGLKQSNAEIVKQFKEAGKAYTEAQTTAERDAAAEAFRQVAEQARDRFEKTGTFYSADEVREQQDRAAKKAFMSAEEQARIARSVKTKLGNQKFKPVDGETGEQMAKRFASYEKSTSALGDPRNVSKLVNQALESKPQTYRPPRPYQPSPAP